MVDIEALKKKLNRLESKREIEEIGKRRREDIQNLKERIKETKKKTREAKFSSRASGTKKVFRSVGRALAITGRGAVKAFKQIPKPPQIKPSKKKKGRIKPRADPLMDFALRG